MAKPDRMVILICESEQAIRKKKKKPIFLSTEDGRQRRKCTTWETKKQVTLPGKWYNKHVWRA